MDLHTGVAVDCLAGDGHLLTGVKFTDSQAEAVIMGIGIIPSIAR